MNKASVILWYSVLFSPSAPSSGLRPAAVVIFMKQCTNYVIAPYMTSSLYIFIEYVPLLFAYFQGSVDHFMSLRCIQEHAKIKASRQPVDGG